MSRVRSKSFAATRVGFWVGGCLLLAAVVSAQQEYRPLRTGGLSAEAAALLMSGQQGGSIPIFALSLPGPADEEGKSSVELFVEAPGAAILAGHEAPELRLEICLYALAGSRVADSSLETVVLDLARDRQRLLAGGVKSRSTLKLAAGSYELRVLLRNVSTGELGLRSIALAVPAAGDEPSLQSLLVPDTVEGWLRLARDPGEPTVGFWPAARPVLQPASDTELQVLVRGLEPDLARLELSGAGGDSIQVPAAISPAATPAPAGFERWLVRTRLPELEPGDYELSLELADRAASPPLPIAVRAGGGTWAGTPGTAPGSAGGAEPSLPTVGDLKGDRREVEKLTRRLSDAYREALDRLAAADPQSAVSALVRLETEAFAQEGGAAAVAAAEMETARALVRSSGGSLVPLFDLHYRSYRRYLEAESFRLSSHARDQLLDMVDLYLSRHGDDPTPATDVLVVMANQLQQSGLARYSRLVFRRALEVDPAHEGALMGLAAGLEKHGEYREACEHLEQLLAARPGHREARLRLAVNLARTQNRGRARRLLAELTAEPDRDWVLAVAYQELARDLLSGNRLDEAERLLAEARERLPGDDQLRLLQAATADARQQATDGRSEELALRSRADRPSARHRYQQWPRYQPGAPPAETGRRLEALAAALQNLRREA